MTRARDVADAGHSTTATTADTISQKTSISLSGTYSTHQLLVADAYTFAGDTTVNDNLILGKLSDDGTDIVLEGSHILQGTGQLEAGYVTSSGIGSVDGMTGELGSAITGSPNLNLGNITFPAGHIIQAKSLDDANVAGSATYTDNSVGEVVNSGIELTIGSGNKALILVTGWQFTRRSSGASSDRVVNLYKEVSGSDTSLGMANAWGEVETQYARAGFSCCCLDTTTGVVRYKLKVAAVGTSGRIEYKTNMIVLEVKG